MARMDRKKVDTFVERQLDELAAQIEEKLGVDVVGVVGPIYGGLDNSVRTALENRHEKGKRPKGIAVVLDTPGGVIEVVERIVKAIRHHHKEVIVIVPDAAMSAGTVLALSADRILMDYFSCLGPIDPQIVRNGKLVPALSYLVQFERLKKKSEEGKLTSAEMVLLQQLDLAELHKFEEAKELSVSLLKEWLATYKFKDWSKTETRGISVTKEMKEERAVEIASGLMNHERWHSHGRPITMGTLRKDLNLKIEDFGEDRGLSEAIRSYHHFLIDYMGKISVFSIVHAEGQCLK